jgi:hypothetical protein
MRLLEALRMRARYAPAEAEVERRGAHRRYHGSKKSSRPTSIIPDTVFERRVIHEYRLHLLPNTDYTSEYRLHHLLIIACRSPANMDYTNL